MDDSMEAFELPSLSKKKLFLSRKKRIISPLASRNEPSTKDVDQNNSGFTKECIPQSSSQSNDTLSGIPDFSDESEGTNEAHNEEPVAQSLEQKENLNREPCSPVSQTVDSGNENHSPGGFCKICSKKIPVDECKTHYIKCMTENFASKKDLKLRIESKLTCANCGKLVDVKSYQDHCMICRNKGLKTNGKPDDTTVTSSYFRQGEGDEIKRDKLPCPSCHKDLAGRTLSARQSHVNRCLDNSNFGSNCSMSSPNRSTPKIRFKQLKVQGQVSQPDSNTCSKCGKTLKTKGGLKRHEQSCKGQPKSSTNKEKGERRKRTAKVPRNAEDEILQVAKALSKSEDEERKRSKREEKLRKKEIGVPVMLQESPATRQAALEAKLVQMIGKSEDVATSTDDCEVPCTPAIPLPSRWEKQCSNSFEEVSQGKHNNQQDLKPFVVLPQPALNEKGCDNGTDDHTDIKSKIETFSAKEDTALPTTSKFATIANSKWGLSSGAHSCPVDYRVSGLLTQFESPELAKETQTAPDCSDALQDKELLYQVIDNDDNVDSTLQQLIELGGSPDEEQAIVEPSFVEDEDDLELNVTASDMEEPHSELIWKNSANILSETPENFNKSRSPCNSFTPDPAVFMDIEKTSNSKETNLNDASLAGTEYGGYSSLQQDYSNLVNCSSYSDLTLRFNGDPAVDVTTHKCILFCRMPSLLQVFEKESVGDICYVQRCDRDEMLCLLDHIYTGSLKKISKLHVEELVQRLGCRNEHSNSALHVERPVDSCDEILPPSTAPASASFVPSDDDLFHDSPVPCSGSIRGGSPTVRLTDFRSRLDESIEIRMDDDETERIYVTNAENDADKSNRLPENVPDEEFRPLVMTKRKSAHFTPLPGNRHKFRRMTGSTPKSPLTKQRAPVARHDTPVDIHDFSSIASHSPHPNLYNSPTLKPRPYNSDPQQNGDVKDSDDDTAEVTQSQPAEIASPEDDVFVTSFSQPVVSKYKFREPPEYMTAPAEPYPEFDFSVNDSVLLSAAVGHVGGAGDAPGLSNFKTPVAARKPRRSTMNVPFTPMLNYSDMDTPNIVKQGQKMGLKRTLGKKKLKVKLKELYAYRHQVVTSDEDESSANDVTAKIQAPPNDTPTNAKPRQVVHVVDSDSDDAKRALACPDRVLIMKTEQRNRKAIKALESLTTDEFKQLFRRALTRMYENGTMLKALERARESTRGIPRGSSDDVQKWLNCVTPGSPQYNPEFTVLASLCSDKQQVIVKALSDFVVNEETIAPFQPHMFDILPTVYRVICRLNPSLLPTYSEVFKIDSSDEEAFNEGSDVEDLHTTHFLPCDVTSSSDLEVAPEQRTAKPKRKTKKIKPSGQDEIDMLMHDVITNDVMLYRDILRYKPIYLSRFKALLKEASFSCNATDLLDYLDRQGITFTTADERKTNNTRTKRRRKPKKAGT